jgi:hypothetical protein
MPVNIEEFFNELLPEAMSRNPECFRRIGYQYTFRITGEGGGVWCVNASQSGPSVMSDDLGNSNLIITMNATDFQGFYKNPHTLTPLFFSDKLKIENDGLEGAGKICEIFNLVKRYLQQNS